MPPFPSGTWLPEQSPPSPFNIARKTPICPLYYSPVSADTYTLFRRQSQDEQLTFGTAASG